MKYFDAYIASLDLHCPAFVELQELCLTAYIYIFVEGMILFAFVRTLFTL